MKALTLTYCVLVGMFSPITAQAEHPLSFLHGDWHGTGITSGMPSSIRFTWKPGFDAQYTVLQLNNRMTTGDGDFEFTGIAYYQESDDQTLGGIWIDNQGNILPLRATLEDRTLTAIWGTEETKLGRSIYRLLPDGQLEAVDFTGDDEGNWHEFGRAVLSRGE